MQGLADGLVDGFVVQFQQGAKARGKTRPEVGDMVDLVFMQADTCDEVYLDFVAGGDTSDQLFTAAPGVLCHGEQRGNVVTRMGVLGRQESVMEVEFPDGNTVGVGGPFRGGELIDSDNARASSMTTDRVGKHLSAGRSERTAQHRCHGYSGVVDEPVDHHFGGFGRDVHRVGSNFGDLPGKVLRAWKLFGAEACSHSVFSHDLHAIQSTAPIKCPANEYFCGMGATVLRILCKGRDGQTICWSTTSALALGAWTEPSGDGATAGPVDKLCQSA